MGVACHVWDWVDETYYTFGHWPFDKYVKVFENDWFIVYRCHWVKPCVWYDYDCILITVKGIEEVKELPIHFIVGAFFKPNTLKIERINEDIKITGEATAEACETFYYEIVIYKRSPLIQFRIYGHDPCGDLEDTSGHKFPSLIIAVIEPYGTSTTAEVYRCVVNWEKYPPYEPKKITDVYRGVDAFTDLPVAELPCTKIVTIPVKDRKYTCIWQIWSCKNIKRAVVRVKQLASLEKDIGTVQFLFNTDRDWEINFVLGFITEYKDVLKGCFFEHKNKYIVDDYRDYEVYLVPNEPCFVFEKVEPKKILVKPNEQVVIKYIVKNVGTKEGKVEVRLIHDTEKIYSKEFSLKPDSSYSTEIKFKAPSERDVFKYTLEAYNVDLDRVDDKVEITIDTTENWPKFDIIKVEVIPTPPLTEPITNQPFNIKTYVKNIGKLSGSCVVELWKENTRIDYKELKNVISDEVKSITFTLSESEKGEYTYQVKVLNKYTNDYDDSESIKVSVLEWWETTLAKSVFGVVGVATVLGAISIFAVPEIKKVFEEKQKVEEKEKSK